MSRFKDKVVVVTGGNSGIGKSIVERFSREGAKVVIFGRNQERLDEVSHSLDGDNITVQGDVRKVTDLEKLMDATKKRFGNIDVLVANAGIGGRRHISEIDEAFFDEIVDINYKGLFFTVQKSIPLLNEGASVILISSVNAHVGYSIHSVYSSTKAAVSQLARNLAADLAENKIRVNAISPGYTDTPIFDPVRKADPDYMAKRIKNIPLKRFASTDEIASATLYLSSDEGAYITGIDFLVDGGVAAVYPIKI